MLNELPDGLIICSAEKVCYMNQEAWNILQCQVSEEANEEIFCLDYVNKRAISPLEQLMSIMSRVDNRFERISIRGFFEKIQNLAQNGTIMIQQAQYMQEELIDKDTSRMNVSEAQENKKSCFDIRIKV